MEWALSEGAIDAAVVTDEFLLHEAENGSLGALYESPNLMQIQFPMAIVINKWNDAVFGGELGKVITERCEDVIKGYSSQSIRDLDWAKAVARERGVPVITVTEDVVESLTRAHLATWGQYLNEDSYDQMRALGEAVDLE